MVQCQVAHSMLEPLDNALPSLLDSSPHSIRSVEKDASEDSTILDARCCHPLDGSSLTARRA